MNKEINIAIFASGSGSNAENIYKYFSKHPFIKVACILCNKPDAFVLTRADELGIEYLVFNKTEFQNKDFVLNFLYSKNVSFIVLAGFLWLIPQYLIDNYENRIINIHPALLPKYGGKGMYGMSVHKAVYENKEKQTGITIHYVNSNYDEGNIIFQEKVDISVSDTPESIAEKVHLLEYKYFPVIIEKILLDL